VDRLTTVPLDQPCRYFGEVAAKVARFGRYFGEVAAKVGPFRCYFPEVAAISSQRVMPISSRNGRSWLATTSAPWYAASALAS
jgi:hypothetical protein